MGRGWGREADKEAQRAIDAALAALKEARGFAQQGIGAAQTGLAWEMDQWNQASEGFEAMYGKVESNMANFYNTLTPETLAATGLRANYEQYNTRKEEIQREYAKRGISSGAQYQLEQDAERQRIERDVQLRQEAKMQIPGLQQNFLEFGLNKRMAEDQLKQGIRGARRNELEAIWEGGRQVLGANQLVVGARQSRSNLLGSMYQTWLQIQEQRKQNDLARDRFDWEKDQADKDNQTKPNPFAKGPGDFLW